MRELDYASEFISNMENRDNEDKIKCIQISPISTWMRNVEPIYMYCGIV
jgi:hypothetical protein